MSKRIIISGKERILNPLKAFLMSILITGMGEVYSGSTQRGIILALLRAASPLAVLFYSLNNMKTSYLTEIFFSILFFLMITFFSPVNSLVTSLNKKKIILSKTNSAGFLALFAGCSIIITLGSVAVFFSAFSFTLMKNSSPPLIENGDIAVIKKITDSRYSRGEMIVLKNENFSITRIIGLPGEKVSYVKGHFSVEDSALQQSIFTESELKKFSLTDYDVISETGGSLKYPVIQSSEGYSADITLKNEEYYAAPDNRAQLSEFAVVKADNIYGRAEGVLLCTKRVKFLVKPYLPSD